VPVGTTDCTHRRHSYRGKIWKDIFIFFSVKACVERYYVGS